MMRQGEDTGPGMTDVTLIAGEVDGTFGGLEGSMECSMDIFSRGSAEQFTRSFEVGHRPKSIKATEKQLPSHFVG